jgi:hypothetical protein
MRFRRNGTADKRVPMAAGNCSYCSEPVGPKGAKGYCAKHYARFKKHGDPSVSLIDREHSGTCSECDQPVIAKGYCTTHYQRWQKHGDPTIVLPGGREGGRKYTLNHEYFDNIATPEQAYWLGFLTADGGVIIGAKTHALRLELAEIDAEQVKMFATAMGSDKPLWNRRGCVGVSLDSWRLVESLGRLGIGQRKSATVEPWNGPADLMPHYWRGLFDGDGCICRSCGRWQMSIVGSEACVHEFATWARGITGSRAKAIRIKHAAACWQWVLGSSRMAVPLARELYENAPVALKRKQLLAGKILGG